MSKQLSKQAVKLELKAIGINYTMSMSEAMNLAKSHLNSSADNAIISQVVKEILSTKNW